MAFQFNLANLIIMQNKDRTILIYNFVLKSIKPLLDCEECIRGHGPLPPLCVTHKFD
jgi:hypothetical protein